MPRGGQLARRLAVAAFLVLATLPTGAAHPNFSEPRQSDAEQLKAELSRQLAEVEAQFAVLRDPAAGPMVAGARLAEWQAELAARFARAAETAARIDRLDPPDAERWRETHETLALYAQPPSGPDSRDVFGARGL